MDVYRFPEVVNEVRFLLPVYCNGCMNNLEGSVKNPGPCMGCVNHPTYARPVDESAEAMRKRYTAA